MLTLCEPCAVNDLEGPEFDEAVNAVATINRGVYNDVEDYRANYALTDEAVAAIRECKLARWCGKCVKLEE